jgi:hypothetical protein
VVPLQDLVQDDAVEETSESQPEEDACRSRKAALLIFAHDASGVRGLIGRALTVPGAQQ